MLHVRNSKLLMLPEAGVPPPTWEVNATENSRMTPDTTDRDSCTQKPIQP